MRISAILRSGPPRAGISSTATFSWEQVSKERDEATVWRPYRVVVQGRTVGKLQWRPACADQLNVDVCFVSRLRRTS